MKKLLFEKKYINSFIIIFGTFFFIVLPLILSLNVHAATNNSSLPYFVDNSIFVNGDGYSFDDLSSFAQTRWGGSGMYDFDFYVPGVLAYNYTEDINGITYNFTSVYVPIPNGNSNYDTNVTINNYSDWNYLNSSIEFRFINYYLFVFSNYRNQYNDCYFAANTFYISFFGNTNKTPDYIGEYFYVIHDGLPVSNQPILVNTSGSDIVLGHATEPNFDGDSFINDSNDNPITRPNQPIINSYTPTVFNPPSLDTTNIESLLVSIWECLVYGFDYLKTNIGGWFNNLLSNLASWFGYLTESIYYLGNKIISAISILADFLFDNFSSLFEPLFDFIKPIVTFFSSLVALGTVDGEFSFITLTDVLFIPSIDDFQDLIEESDTLDLITISNTIVSSVRSIWTGILGISPIKIIHVPSLYYHGVQIGNFDIDFTWYDSYKPLGDGIISAFLIFNYLWFLFFRLPSFLRGSSNDFNHDVQAAADSGHETFKGKVGF